MKLKKMIRYFKTSLNLLFKPEIVKTNPIYVQLEPSTHCNLHCPSCCRDELIKNARNLSFEDFKIFFDEFRPTKMAMSGAGEPFLNPDFLKMVKYAKDNGASVLTTSNMTLITEKKAREIVDSGLDLLKMSIDSANKETYLNVRGEDSFDKILEGIDLINSFKKEERVNTPHLRFQFVVQGKNYKELPNLFQLAKDKGIEAVFLQPVDWRNVEEKKDELLAGFDLNILKDLLLQSKAFAEENGISSNIKEILNNFDFYFSDRGGKPTEKRVCVMPWFSLFISVDGDVRPCCSFITSDPYLGNIKKDGLKNIWNNEEYRRMRKLIRQGKYEYKVCQGCHPPILNDVVNIKNILPGFSDERD